MEQKLRSGGKKAFQWIDTNFLITKIVFLNEICTFHLTLKMEGIQNLHKNFGVLSLIEWNIDVCAIEETDIFEFTK